MADDSSAPQPASSHYQRTTGDHLRWQPPTPERLQEMLTAYEILGILGQGGMGAVYKGRQKSLDRDVAIKILPPEAAESDMQFVERFKNEARTMAKMNHPAIVKVYDFGETNEGQLYIVMEFIDGTDVARMIASQGKLPPEHALAISAHVCDALKYAHEHGVIHRDIKPANVLINMEGEVKVADFGLAKATDAGQSSVTRTNVAVGTPDFLAPEALIPGIMLDGRADLYAVGVMLYQMLTGMVPRGAFRMPGKTMNTDPRFDHIIGKAMEMDREQRYQTALAIRKDLDVILTTPLIEAGGQSSAAVPKQQVPCKPAGGQENAESSTSKPNQNRVTGSDGGEDGSNCDSPEKKSPGLLLRAFAAIVIAAGLLYMFLHGGRSVKDGNAQNVSQLEENTDVDEKGAAQAALPEMPRNKWISVLDTADAAKNRKNVTWSDGWISISKNTPLSALISLKGGMMQNLSLRASVRPPVGTLQWVFRDSKEGNYHLSVSPNALELFRLDRSQEKTAATSLIRTSLPAGLIGAKEWKLEATIRGNVFKASVNGRQLISKSGLMYASRGKVQFHTGSAKELVMKDIAIMWLDDTAGVKPAELPSPAAAANPSTSDPVSPKLPAVESAPAARLAEATAMTPAPEPAPKSMAAPPPAPTDPRLVQLAAGFNTRYETEAQNPYLAAVAALNQSYIVNGIGRARTAAQAKGSLDEVTSLDAEKAIIEKGTCVPVEDAAGIPDSLKTLRSTYRSALAKITAVRDASAAPLYDLYLNALDGYVAELTKANRIDEAQKVNALRGDIAAKVVRPQPPSVADVPSKPLPVMSARADKLDDPLWLSGAKKRGGKLHVEGTLPKDIPVELGPAADFDDFIEVYAFKEGWLAKRAGGDAVVASHPGSKSKTHFLIEKSVEQVSRGSLVYVLASGELKQSSGSAGIISVTTLERTKGITLGGTSGQTLVLGPKGEVIWSKNGKDHHLPPPDFFVGMSCWTSLSPFEYATIMPDGEFKCWNTKQGEVMTNVTGLQDIVEMEPSPVVMRRADGKVFVLNDDGGKLDRNSIKLPRPSMPPAIRVRACEGLYAAQMADGTWRSWGSSGSLVTRIRKIGPALDLDATSDDPAKGYLMWIENPSLAAK